MVLIQRSVVITTIAAVLLFVVGGVVLKVIPRAIRKAIESDLKLEKPSSSMYKSFANTSSQLDVYTAYYMFHCENPHDVAYNGAVPKVVQKGPFTYLMQKWRNQDNITWRPNATIEYTYHDTYTFVPSKSVGTEDDAITTLDLGLIGVFFQTFNELGEAGLDLATYMANTFAPELFVNKTVKEIIWGYNNTFLGDLKQKALISLVVNDDPTTFFAPSAAYTGGQPADGYPSPPDHSLLKMTKWEGYEQLPYWGSEYANMINGTDGTSFWPGITGDDSPYVFVDTLYRSVRMEFRGDVTYEGVGLLRFALAESDTLSMSQNPNNMAFAMHETGFLPMPPSLGLPIVFSKPHFLDASLDNVKLDITPAPIDRLLYETALDVEPNTGYLFKVNKRIQLNAFVNNSWLTRVVTTPNVTSTWYPIMWGDEYALFPENLVNDFKRDVQIPLRACEGVGITCFVVGSILCVLTLVLLFRANRQNNDEYTDVESEKLNSAINQNIGDRN